jgi:enoyl-CoA hydratase/carnithine racemase
MSEDSLHLDMIPPVATLTINREKNRNAISPELIRAFLGYLDKLETDDSIRVLVVTGVGDKAFCSGADLSGAMHGDPENVLGVFKEYASLIKRLVAFPKPTVARVNGSCVAGGTGFMLACDIVIASRKARFGTPEVNVGLFPMMIGSLIFSHVLRKPAMEMMLLGELFDADKAREMGLVTRVVSPEYLDAEVKAVTETLASKSPLALKLGKKALMAIDTLSFDASVDYLATQLMAVMNTEDAVEGISAFIERRPPVFKGR